MKSFAILLILANAAIAAWLALFGPLEQTREPSRLSLQIAADRFHLASDADIDRQRAAQAPDPARPATIDLPRADCLVINGFSSAAMAHRVLSRLNAQIAGLHATPDKDEATELRIEAVSGAEELAVQKILADFPRVSMAHCLASVSVPATP